MIKISVNYSNSFKRFFGSYPDLFEKAKRNASKRVLVLWQERSVHLAPYKTGTLRREIRALYNENTFTAGNELSMPYALIHDKGGYAGRGHKAYIKPKHYFFKMASDSSNEVLEIYQDEFRKAMHG